LYLHLHETLTGLRQRISAAGIRLVSVEETGGKWCGSQVGYVPQYTVTLARDDDRTLAETISTGIEGWQPTAFEVVDTWLCQATLMIVEGIGVTPEGEALAERFRNFVEGPACWDDWLYYTDRDPGRQEDYDEPGNEDEDTDSE